MIPSLIGLECVSAFALVTIISARLIIFLPLKLWLPWHETRASLEPPTTNLTNLQSTSPALLMCWLGIFLSSGVSSGVSTHHLFSNSKCHFLKSSGKEVVAGHGSKSFGKGSTLLSPLPTPESQENQCGILCSPEQEHLKCRY